LRKPVIGVLVAAAVLAVAAVALASPQYKATFNNPFTTNHPNKPTGFNTLITYSDPGAPNQKPAPVNRVDVIFPTGTKFDNKAVGNCNGKADSQVLGGGCPASSLLGTGKAVANAKPILQCDAKLDIKAYNTSKPAGIIFALRSSDPKCPAGQLVLHGTLKGLKLTTIVPPLKLPDGSLVSTTRFQLNIKVKGSKSKPYAKTPKTCPKSGSWVSNTTYFYDSSTGQKPYKTTSKQKCARK
jgi:hypothetical protein